MGEGEEEEQMGTSNEFDLPDEVLGVLPSDPFSQLDIARKITSIALSTRVSALESEVSVLRAQLTDRDNIIADLQSQIESLDASLADAVDRLALAEQEKVRFDSVRFTFTRFDFWGLWVAGEFVEGKQLVV